MWQLSRLSFFCTRSAWPGVDVLKWHLVRRFVIRRRCRTRLGYRSANHVAAHGSKCEHKEHACEEPTALDTISPVLGYNLATATIEIVILREIEDLVFRHSLASINAVILSSIVELVMHPQATAQSPKSVPRSVVFGSQTPSNGGVLLTHLSCRRLLLLLGNQTTNLTRIIKIYRSLMIDLASPDMPALVARHLTSLCLPREQFGACS